MTSEFEKGPEHIPTHEEVLSVLKELIGEAGYEETRKLEDEKGLYLWDIEISTEDGRTEYSYRRGRPEVGELPGLRIDVAYYDADGFPVSGSSVAYYTNGQWRLTP